MVVVVVVNVNVNVAVVANVNVDVVVNVIVRAWAPLLLLDLSPRRLGHDSVHDRDRVHVHVHVHVHDYDYDVVPTVPTARSFLWVPPPTPHRPS